MQVSLQLLHAIPIFYTHGFPELHVGTLHMYANLSAYFEVLDRSSWLIVD